MGRCARYVMSRDLPDGRSCHMFQAVVPCLARDMLLSLGLSKSVVARLFASGRLFAHCGESGVPDTPLGPSYALESGDTVCITCGAVSEEHPMCVTPPFKREHAGVAISVLYEDPFVLAVDKPAGILVHGDGSGATTLTDLVRARCSCRGANVSVQAVQRLDVDTTGIVLFSKLSEFQGLFDAMMAQKGDGGVSKDYLAVVRGSFPEGGAVYTDAIARDRHDARRMRVTVRGGQEALTRARLIEVSPDGAHSLVYVRLGTGRRHQIRVHFSAHGYPIVNDALYGSTESSSGLMLHAYRERFVHPVTGEPVDICAGWPSRFGEWFDEPAW